MGREISLDQTFEITDPEIQKKIIAIYQEAFDPKRLSLEEFDIHRYFDALLPPIAEKFDLKYVVLRSEDPEDKERNRLQILASYGLDLPSREKIDLDTEASKQKGVASVVSSGRIAYYMEDVRSDTRYAQVNFAEEYDFGPGIGCPIVTGGMFVGLVMYYKKRGSQFREDEINFLVRMLRTVIQTIFVTAEKLDRSRSNYLEMLIDTALMQSYLQMNVHDAKNCARSTVEFVEKIRQILSGMPESEGRERALKYGEFAIESSNQTQNLLLSALREEGGQETIDDLAKLIADAWEMMRFILRDTTVDFRLPAGAVAIKGNPAHLRQVFRNVFLNAQRAIEESGQKGRIEIALEYDTRRIHVSIRDNGIGMNNEQLRTVLTARRSFWRYKPGSGMGLSLCRRIVEGMGGSIRITGELSKGTTVEFSFRRQPGKEKPVP